MRDFHSDYKPPVGSYHDAKAIHQAIGKTVGSLPAESQPPAEVVSETVGSLGSSYTACAQRANEPGLPDWEVQIVHGDWHPGNMLFRDHQVVAVIDYDSARVQQRVIDLANGVLQFSILGGGDDPSKWPDHLDENRFKRFLLGYDSVNVITQAEIRTIPFLMCEAMIAEAVLPIAATGSFGRMEGFPFLQMIDRKVRWVLSHLDRLYAMLE
jgi:homoserine kinase type II